MVSDTNSGSQKIGFRHSLRTRMLVFFLALAIIPLIIISVLGLIESQNALEGRIKADLESITELQGIMLRDFLAQRKDNVVVLAGTARVRTMDPTKVGDAIDQYYKQWGVYENMGLYDLEGNTVYRTDKTQINVADREYFIKALAGETNISDPILSKASGNIVL